MEENYTVELCYMGMIDLDVDAELREFMSETIDMFEDITGSWYFQESTLSEPHHRLIGWSLSRPLSYLERIYIHHTLLENYDGSVFIIAA